MNEPFAEFAVLLIITAAVSALAVRLRQPVLIAYIAVGILVGPAGFSLVTAHDQIDLLAQISEFSIIFVAMGISLGHIGNNALGLTTLVGLITIALSSYMIIYSHRLYTWMAPWLGVFERLHPFRELAVEHAQRDSVQPDIIVFGLGRYGSRLAHTLKQQGIKVVGVDFDPEVVRALQNQGMDARFGDGEAPDYIESLPVAHTPWIVSTLPDYASNFALLHALKEQHYEGHIAIVARDENEAARLGKLDDIEVIHPFNQAADFAALDLAARIASAELSANKESP